MCGRYLLLEDPLEMKRYIGWEAVDPHYVYEPRFNLAPGEKAPVFALRESGTVQLGMMRWGLIPSWSKDEKSTGWINARSETIDQKPSFKNAFAKRRCVVPASGFYEWKKSGGKGAKTPTVFKPQHQEPLLFAGVWEKWREAESFALVTTGANALMSRVHDRMPVILSLEKAMRWLQPKPASLAILKDLLVPAPEDILLAQEVGTFVNSPGHEGPECLALPTGPAQGSFKI
jgi:putative SOS response-associated peptidase YedK